MSIRESLLGINEGKGNNNKDDIPKTDVFLNNHQSLKEFEINRLKTIKYIKNKVNLLTKGVIVVAYVSTITVSHKELLENDLIYLLPFFSKSLHNFEENVDKYGERLQNDDVLDYI